MITPPKHQNPESILANSPATIFDRKAVALHRDRAARLIAAGKSDDFLYAEIRERLADCLQDVNRSFPRVLELGCRGGGLYSLVKDRCGSELYQQTDLSPEMVKLAERNGQPTQIMDDERINFAEASFDLVLAAGGLHWVNDLPGTLIQIRRVLKPDGLFLGACISGDTLIDARAAMMETEQTIMGGVSPRFSPSFDTRDAAGLMQRAGFALPVADLHKLTVSHSSALKLMHDLRAMGETNAHSQRLKRFSSRSLLLSFAAALQQSDEKITSVFDLILLTGWAPDASQQQPLKPGSATKSFTEIL